ncbi:Asp23/Gls24 family envelope stress response protein [Streptomyces sp. L2]|uniref:Asp23/Gls24 family envelope stress response protein n=1 Tax=Streptomyces sp. L2 TaxID=2162665 RepID=UPI001F5054FA|nr:Asp23/Gls24 family envelope stress response protein [Streptomyces sp. L2]
MTAQRNPTELTERIAQAVLGVPGVAFLRPGLAGLLRASASVMARVGDRSNAGEQWERERTRSAVRVRRGAGQRTTAVEVSIVLSRGHRALDVARAVHAAVERAAAGPSGSDGADLGVTVTVTVTGLV